MTSLGGVTDWRDPKAIAVVLPRSANTSEAMVPADTAEVTSTLIVWPAVNGPTIAWVVADGGGAFAQVIVPSCHEGADVRTANPLLWVDVAVSSSSALATAGTAVRSNIR